MQLRKQVLPTLCRPRRPAGASATPSGGWLCWESRLRSSAEGSQPGRAGRQWRPSTRRHRDDSEGSLAGGQVWSSRFAFLLGESSEGHVSCSGAIERRIPSMAVCLFVCLFVCFFFANNF